MNEDRKNRNTLWPGQSNLGNGVRAEPLEANSRERRGETKLEFPNGQPDLDALRSVTREWLVPLLVEKFLRDQGIASRVLPGNANFQFVSEEALDSRNGAPPALHPTARSAEQGKSTYRRMSANKKKQLPGDR